jgi:hypothetical protein
MRRTITMRRTPRHQDQHTNVIAVMLKTLWLCTLILVSPWRNLNSVLIRDTIHCDYGRHSRTMVFVKGGTFERYMRNSYNVHDSKLTSPKTYASNFGKMIQTWKYWSLTYVFYISNYYPVLSISIVWKLPNPWLKSKRLRSASFPPTRHPPTHEERLKPSFMVPRSPAKA